MDPASERIHGISAADLAAEPPFAACAAELHALFTDAQVLIGYNVGFDLDMLQAEFARASLSPLDVGDKLIVDPYQLWSAIEPRGLRYAHRRFVGSDFDGAHRAQADVAATAAVLCGRLATFGLLPEWYSLAELCRGRRAQPMDTRQARGEHLAQLYGARIKPVDGDLWFVPSSDGIGGYLVSTAPAATGPRCSCPDATRGTKRKHVWAVEFALQAQGALPAAGGAAVAPAPQKAPAWPQPLRRGQRGDLTADEQGHVKVAQRFLRIQHGG